MRHEPIRGFISTNKGRRFLLDCGHKATIGDGRSNTIIIYSTGKTCCHKCGY